MLPYWYDAIVPDLLAGQLVLVSAHGNSLRALVKHLDGIPDTEIAELNLPTGVPLLYELDSRMRPIGAVDPRFGVSGTYLDLDAATSSIASVKNQGQLPAPGMTCPARRGELALAPSEPTSLGQHSRGNRHEHALGELDEPVRIAPLVVVPGDDLHLRPVDHRGQTGSRRSRSTTT